MSGLLVFIWALVWPPAISARAGILRGDGVFRHRRASFGAWIAGALTAGIAGAVAGIWWWALGSAVSIAVAVCWWWFNRRRRDRAKALLGAKSKALRDALVAKQREVTKPRPMLRPVPGGAS